MQDTMGLPVSAHASNSTYWSGRAQALTSLDILQNTKYSVHTAHQLLHGCALLLLHPLHNSGSVQLGLPLPQLCSTRCASSLRRVQPVAQRSGILLAAACSCPVLDRGAQPLQ